MLGQRERLPERSTVIKAINYSIKHQASLTRYPLDKIILHTIRFETGPNQLDVAF